MSQILVTAGQGEKGCKVRAYPTGKVMRPDGTAMVQTFMVMFGVGDGNSLAVYGFTEDTLERFLTDTYTAVHEALTAARAAVLEEPVRVSA